MKSVAGTQGYEQKIEAFIDASRGLVFEEINQDFLPFSSRLIIFSNSCA